MQADWLNIVPLEGYTGQTNVYVDVAENEIVGGTRFATVRFTNTDGLYADLNLTQTSNTEDMSAILSPNTLEVHKTGGTYYVDIISNTYWRVVSYLKNYVTVYSDNPDGAGDGRLTIVFPPNNKNTERAGFVTVSTLAGDRFINWTQPGYDALSVSPGSLTFSQSGESKTVTITASNDWTVTQYDNSLVTLSVTAGTSGQTTITVTKAPLTQNQINYFETAPTTVVFNDGVTNATLKLASSIDAYSIDDDYVTATYYVPSANTEIEIYGIMTSICGTAVKDSKPSSVLFQDENYTGLRNASVSYPTLGSSYRDTYYVTFTTAGYHKIKYKFSDSTVIQRLMFYNNKNIREVVVGKGCSGQIGDGALYNATNCHLVSIGEANIVKIGGVAFYGCGSSSTDFVFPGTVQETGWAAFQNFTARKFIFNGKNLGSTNSAGNTETGCCIQYVYGTYIGKETKWTGTSSFNSWAINFGDLTCDEFVFGKNVETINRSWFYPYSYSVSFNGGVLNVVDYANQLVYGISSPKVTQGVKYNKLTSLRSEPPSGSPATFMNKSTTSINVRNYGTVSKSFGPSTTLPFHYPIGANYNSWLSTFTNNYSDIDI